MVQVEAVLRESTATPGQRVEHDAESEVCAASFVMEFPKGVWYSIDARRVRCD